MSHRTLAQAITILGTLAAAAKAQTVQEVPIFPPDLVPTEITISGDGETVAVAARDRSRTLIQTTRHGQVTTFGPVLFLSSVAAVSVTNTGRVFAGNLAHGSMNAGEWTSTGFIPFDQVGFNMLDLADDGSVQLVQTGGRNAALYSGNVRMDDVPELPGYLGVYPCAMSPNGRTIAGYVVDPRDRNRLVGVLWQDLAPTILPSDGWAQVVPLDISAEGSVIAGYVESTSRASRAALWINGSGPILPAPEMRVADHVCRGGRIIYGHTGDTAMMWTPWAGLRTFAQLGIPDLYRSIYTSFASRDGSKLVGLSHASGGRPLLVTLSQECELDYATDGFIDFFDYAAFAACFEGDCPNDRSADFNMDGFVDFFDYADYVDRFAQGC